MFSHGVKPAGIFAQAHKYCMVDGLLYRKVNRPDGLELRCCAPRGNIRGIFAIVGRKPLPYRKELILHYHNGKLGAHVGREQTISRIEADWYWPNLRMDVDRWIAGCTVCQGQHGIPAVSAWSRTSLYSKPFRCLVFDTVKCPTDPMTGYDELLTVICPFSRFCWAIPMKGRSAQTIATALLTQVFLPWGAWPVVLRSDNATEHIGEVVGYLCRILEIDHITGAVYHPQSQGSVERMHRTLNKLVRQILASVCAKNRQRWVEILPFAISQLRSTPMACLGGRSPMQIVFGIKPQMPQTLSSRLPVEAIGAGTYCEQLVAYLHKVQDEVKALSKEIAQMKEGTKDGGHGGGVDVADVVMMRKDKNSQPGGTTRFEDRCDGELYRVSKKLGQGTVELETMDGKPLMDPLKSQKRKISTDYLVKCDMPELDLELNSSSPRKLEIMDHEDHNVWHEATVEKFTADGRAVLRYENMPNPKLIDLLQERYRWLQRSPPHNAAAAA